MGSFLLDGQDVEVATLPGFCCRTRAVSLWDNEGRQVLLATAEAVDGPTLALEIYQETVKGAVIGTKAP
jgi:hypothetical protein